MKPTGTAEVKVEACKPVVKSLNKGFLNKAEQKVDFRDATEFKLYEFDVRVETKELAKVKPLEECQVQDRADLD